MTQTLVDFNASTAGGLPTGWTRRHAITTGGWTVTNSAAYDGSSKGLVGAFSVSGRNMLACDALDGVSADMEVYCRFKSTSAANADARITLRGSGAAGSETGYSLGCVNNGIRISKSVSSTSTNFGTDYAFGLTVGTWYHMVARVNGTALSVKVWADGDSEPGSPQKTATDSSITAAGWNGIYQFVITGTNTFDRYFGFGTAGDPAPRIPNSEGLAAGGFAFTGSATGATDKAGVASGGFSYAGAASGQRSPGGKNIVGTYRFTGAGAGQKSPAGVASGGFAFTGAASGTAPAVGANSGDTAGLFSFAGNATGTTAYSGTTSGTFTITGAATGSTPTLAVNTGTAAGSYTFTGTASGITSRAGAASVGIAWTGSAAGVTPPDIPTTGSATSSIVWLGAATGDSYSDGQAEGFYGFTAAAQGAANNNGTASGGFDWTGATYPAVVDSTYNVTVTMYELDVTPRTYELALAPTFRDTSITPRTYDTAPATPKAYDLPVTVEVY